MSQVSNGIFALLAAAATFGAIQFASGSDLGSTRGDTRQSRVDLSGVNRTAKADRASPRLPLVPGTTLSFKTDSLVDTSVLMRLHAKPIEVETVNNAPASISLRPTPGRKSTVACEPVVSVLTEIAKHLQPGRCIT
ncbi:MAG TPA: hypothetical protein VIQ05_03335 [Tardiphaga sp.]